MDTSKVYKRALATLLSLMICIGVFPLSASARTAHPFTVVAGVPGDATSGTCAENSPATNSKLHLSDLSKIVVDSNANCCYIADTNNHAVRKVDAGGQISTFFQGQPYQGTNYYQPSGVAVDSQGNVYIGDWAYCEVLKFDSHGNYIDYLNLQNALGSGHNGRPKGMCFGPDGCLYIADDQLRVVWKCDWNTKALSVAVGQLNSYGWVTPGQTVSSNTPCLNQPSDVAFDPDGNMFVADFQSSEVYKVSNGQISVFAGTLGNSSVNIDNTHSVDRAASNIGNPESIQFDSHGNAYISSLGMNRILRIDKNSDTVYSFAGSGQYGAPQTSYPEASSAQFGYVTGLAIGPDDSVYLCDITNHVSKVEAVEVTDPTVVDSSRNTVSVSPTVTQPGGSVTITAVGDGQNDATTVENSQRYVASSWSSSETGKSGNFDAAGKATYVPSQLGSITITATFKKQVYTGGAWTDAAGDGATATQTAGLVVGSDSPIVTAVGKGTALFSGDGNSAVTSCLNSPSSITYDTAGNMYIADTLNNRIRKVNTQGVISTFAGGGTSSADGVPATSAVLNTPEGMTFDSAGNLYVADAGNNKVRKITPNGIITTVAGCGQYGFDGDGAAAVNAKFRHPTGVAFDSRGNLYITDYYNARVREVTPNGNIQTIMGCDQQGYSVDGSITASTRLWNPCSIAVDKQDNLYIGDEGANCVFRINAAHTAFSTFAGTGGHRGNSGDSGPANHANMDYPGGLVFDADGNLYISDNGNGRIRKVYTNGIITTVAGGGTSDADNIPALQARLVQPAGLTIDPAGNLRFTESGRNKVRVVMSVPEVIQNPAPTPISGPSSGSTIPSLPSLVTNTPTGTQAELSGAVFPANVTAVSLVVTPAWPSSSTDPQTAAASQVMFASITPDTIGSPFLYNIKLVDQNGNPITFTGSVTVKLPLPSGLRGTPHVFRYEPDTKTFTDMNAKSENKFLVFSTTHLSNYVVAGMGDAIVLDTLNYQMPVGGKYQIGVKLAGKKASSLKFHSTNDKIATVVKMKNGNYQVNGKGTGTVYIMFDVYDGKNKFLTHASVRVDVKTGIRPKGDSTRQIGMF